MATLLGRVQPIRHSVQHNFHNIQQIRFSFSFLNKSTPCVHKERKLVGYSPSQLYNVVVDVGSYDKFLPFCKKSTVLFQTDYLMESELSVGFHFFNERYVTRAELVPNHKVRARAITASLFEFLNTHWDFYPGSTPNSCILDFGVEFQFRSPLYNQAASVFLNEVSKQMVLAFENRCRVVYGPASLTSKILDRDLPLPQIDIETNLNSPTQTQAQARHTSSLGNPNLEQYLEFDTEKGKVTIRRRNTRSLSPPPQLSLPQLSTEANQLPLSVPVKLMRRNSRPINGTLCEELEENNVTLRRRRSGRIRKKSASKARESYKSLYGSWDFFLGGLTNR